MTCADPECPNLAVRGGKCWTHIKRMQRHGRHISGPPREYGPHARLLRAALRYASASDLETEDAREYAYSRRDLGRAAIAYAQHLLGLAMEAGAANEDAELAANDNRETTALGNAEPSGC